jgi:hypothetical protein
MFIYSFCKEVAEKEKARVVHYSLTANRKEVDMKRMILTK